MRRVLLLLVLSFCVLPFAGAQIAQPPVNVPSPNASSLGLYGEVPVSLFTGLPNISVPIYNAQEGKLTIPVSLSYHASGFRPDVHPGWVGQGWALNAGGVITRSVNDMPDDYNPPARTTMTYNLAGYYFMHNSLALSDQINAANISTLRGNIFGVFDDSRDLRDTEPDIFSFSFAGYSGRFYQAPDGTWKADSDKHLRITLTTNPSDATDGFRTVPFAAVRGNIFSNWPNPGSFFSKTFNGFTITTDDGTQYIFGNNTDAIEYSIGMLSQRHGAENIYKAVEGVDCSWIADSWYLTKVIHPDSHQITFTYSNERADKIYICQMYSAMQVNLGTTFSSGIYACGSSSSSNYQAYNNGRLVSPVYLSSIETTNTTTRFVTARSIELRYSEAGVFNPAYDAWCYKMTQSAFPPSLDSFLPCLQDDPDDNTGYPACLSRLQWRKLTTVQVERKNGQLLRKYALGYTDNPNERLTLKSVQEIGNDGSDKPPYRFEYYPISQLVPYLSFKVDHWGFFNNISAFPSAADFSDYELHRNPTQFLNIAIGGILSKITYPTGGVTEFEYQQNRYSKALTKTRSQCISANSNAGGVRISVVRSYSLENPQQKTEKKYYYVKGYNSQTVDPDQLPSSGVLGGQYQYIYTQEVHGYIGSIQQIGIYNPSVVAVLLGLGNNTPLPLSVIPYTTHVFSSQSVLPACSNSQGSHIGYSVIVEKNSDGSYKKYYYSNFDANYSDFNSTIIEPSHLDDLAAVTLSPGAPPYGFTPYQPYSDRQEERGKLVQEENYSSADVLVKVVNTAYSIYNKGAGFDIPSVKARTFWLCNNYDPLQPVTPIAPEATLHAYYTYSYLPHIITETIYNAAGNQPLTTIKQIDYTTYKLVSQETTTDSQGQTVQTQLTYPGSYNYAGTPAASSVAGTMAAMALPGTDGKHMLAYPVETRIYRGGQLVSATAQTYKSVASNGDNPQPYQTFRLATDRPQTSYQQFQFTGNATPTRDINMQPQTTFTAYDDKGNPLTWNREDDAPMSYQWGYAKQLPVALFTNASRVPVDLSSPAIGNEASYLGFESGTSALLNTNEDYWNNEMTVAFNEPVGTDAHTGSYSWRVGPRPPGNSTFGPSRTFSPERQQLRYKLSAWVKTGAGYVSGDAKLALAVNHAPSVQGGASLTVSSADKQEPISITNGQWRYYEVLVDLQAVHTQMIIPVTSERFQVVAYSYNGGNGSYQIDDIRFQPVDSQSSTYTFDAAMGQPTSSSPADGRPIYSIYDAFQRLYMVKDYIGNIVKHYEYHYQR